MEKMSNVVSGDKERELVK